MATATRGQIISIKAMEKEFVNLSAKAKRYKREADEAINVSSEFLAIHKELADVINDKTLESKVVLEKIDELKKRDEIARKIMERDICSLTERQVKAEFEAISLHSEIYYAKIRAGIS